MIPDRVRVRPATIVVAVAGVLSLVALGALARRSGSLPFLVAGMLLAVDVVLVRWSQPRPGRLVGDPHRVVVLLGASWVAMAFLPVHDFDPQSSRAALTGLTMQTAAELALFGLVGAFAVFLLRAYVPFVAPGAALTILPVWVLTSAVWADAPRYAIGRGLEYVAMTAVAAATAGLAARGRDALEEVIALFLRWTTRVTMVLILLGIVFGPRFVVETASNRDRFTWIGAHPTASGFLLGATLLVLVSTNSRQLQVPATVRATFVVVAAVALYQNQTRTVLAGLVVGGAVLFVLHGRRHPDAAALSGFFAVGGTVVAVLVAGGALGSYILRGGDSSRLTTLNGRSDLWGVGFDALTGPLEWFHGLGFGATRVVFVDQYAFAGNAHNSVLGMLVGLGIVGVLLLLVAVLVAVFALVRSGFVSTSTHGPTMVALLAYVLVNAITSDCLAEPHYGLVFLYLGTAAGVGWFAVARHTDRQLAGPPDEVAATGGSGAAARESSRA